MENSNVLSVIWAPAWYDFDLNGMHYLIKFTVTKYIKSDVFLSDALQALVENQSKGITTSPIKVKVLRLSGLCIVFVNFH